MYPYISPHSIHYIVLLLTFHSHFLSEHCVALMVNHRLIISSGRRLHICDIPSSPDDTFHVTCSHTLPSDALAARQLGDNLLLVLLDTFQTHVITLDKGTLVGSASLPFASRVSRDDLVGLAVAAVPRTSGRHVFAVFRGFVAVIRRLRVPERVRLLVARGEFSAAMTMCQQLKKREALNEIANTYACYLWEEKEEYAQAMFIWAEYTLPVAGAEYWREFASRLEKVRCILSVILNIILWLMFILEWEIALFGAVFAV